MKTFIAAALVAIVFAEEEAVVADEAATEEVGPAKTEWTAVAKDTATGVKFSLEGAYWVGDDAAGASALHITSTIDGPKQSKAAGVGYGVWASIPEMGQKVLTEEELKAYEEAMNEPVEEVEAPEETEEVEVVEIEPIVLRYDEVLWNAHVTIAEDVATATDVEVHSKVTEGIPDYKPFEGLQAEGGRWAAPTVAAALSEDGKSTAVTFDSSRALDHEDLPLHGGFEHTAAVGFGIGADVAGGASAVGSGMGTLVILLPGDGAMALAATGLAASATMALLM